MRYVLLTIVVSLAAMFLYPFLVTFSQYLITSYKELQEGVKDQLEELPEEEVEKKEMVEEEIKKEEKL